MGMAGKFGTTRSYVADRLSKIVTTVAQLKAMQHEWLGTAFRPGLLRVLTRPLCLCCQYAGVCSPFPRLTGLSTQ